MPFMVEQRFMSVCKHILFFNLPDVIYSLLMENIRIPFALIFQASDSVDVCQFDIHNEAHWKSMSSDAIVSVCGLGSTSSWPVPPPLSPSILDPHLLSNDLEQQLKILVIEHRRVSRFFFFLVSDFILFTFELNMDVICSCKSFSFWLIQRAQVDFGFL